MSRDTRRDLLLGIDNMITDLLSAIRLERRIYDDSFVKIEKPSEMLNMNKEEERFFPSTSCKATQTVQTFPAASNIYDSPVDLRLNQEILSRQKCNLSKCAKAGTVSSAHRSCCLSRAHRCKGDSNGRFTILCPSHTNSSSSCSCKLYLNKCCSTPKYSNIDQSQTGNITHSNHILSGDTKNSHNERRMSSTSGCSSACSTCQRYSYGCITPKYPSESFPTKSDCSCSCRMHT